MIQMVFALHFEDTLSPSHKNLNVLMKYFKKWRNAIYDEENVSIDYFSG